MELARQVDAGVMLCCLTNKNHVITVFRTLDNVKNYIYLVVDNYSRSILAWEVAFDCKAKYVFENLLRLIREHLQPAGILSCQLISDDGAENYGPVKTLVNQPRQPYIEHLIAQCDIEFSNSMSESVNTHRRRVFNFS